MDKIKKYRTESNELHRADGPTIIGYREDNSVWMEGYLIDGRKHRDDGPAVVCWHDNGVVEQESYYVNGNRHREDGPAVKEFIHSEEHVDSYRNKLEFAIG